MPRIEEERSEVLHQKTARSRGRLLLIAALVSAQDVSYNFDQKADFAKFKTDKSKQIDTKASSEKRQKNLDKGMAKLLKQYPPPKPKK